jgi:hypothetical protein
MRRWGVRERTRYVHGRIDLSVGDDTSADHVIGVVALR